MPQVEEVDGGEVLGQFSVTAETVKRCVTGEHQENESFTQPRGASVVMKCLQQIQDAQRADKVRVKKRQCCKFGRRRGGRITS